MHILIWVIVGTFAMAGLDLIFPVVVRELIHDVLPAAQGSFSYSISSISRSSMRCSTMGMS